MHFGIIHDFFVPYFVFVPFPPSLGSLFLFFLVMIVMPEGTTNSSGSTQWLGYAYVNWYLMVINDTWSSSVSVLTHEFGHNLGLGHAGLLNGSEYADQIGFVSSAHIVVNNNDLYFSLFF